MSLTTITIGTNDYQSYASVAEADVELAVDLQRRTYWGALSDDDKGLRLVAATRRLDALAWAGERASDSQANEWPRVNMSPTPSADIPPELEKATALLAGDLAVDVSGAPASATDDSVVQMQTVGPTSVSYFSRRIERTAQHQPIGAPSALACIAQWLQARGIAAPESYGTDGESEFVPVDRFGRTQEGIA